MTGAPLGYDTFSQVVGKNQMPVLARALPDITPACLVAFDDLNRAKNTKETAIHFYKDDYKFSSVVRMPLEFISKAKDFGAVISPDISISASMPPFMRVGRIVASRLCAATWQQHGLNVIPNIRWSTAEDLEYALEGIPTESKIAVSNHGILRYPTLRREFNLGLTKVIDLLNPSQLLIYGSLAKDTKESLAGFCDYLVFSPRGNFKQANIPTKVGISSEQSPTLF